ncbi:MAG: hypothetical protein WBA25_13565 [Jannaschia sp.]
MSPLLRKAALFTAIFFVANLAFGAYRAGGLTSGVVVSAIVTSLLATGLYLLITYVMNRRREKNR